MSLHHLPECEAEPSTRLSHWQLLRTDREYRRLLRRMIHGILTALAFASLLALALAAAMDGNWEKGTFMLTGMIAVLVADLTER